jgi:hypothetical protein
MKREVIRVEPLSTYLEKWNAPTSAVTRRAKRSTYRDFRRSTPKPERSLTLRSSALGEPFPKSAPVAELQMH